MKSKLIRDNPIIDTSKPPFFWPLFGMTSKLLIWRLRGKGNRMGLPPCPWKPHLLNTMTEACLVAQGLFLLADLSFWEGQEPNLTTWQMSSSTNSTWGHWGGAATPTRTRRGSIDWPLARRTRLAWWLNRASSNLVWAKATRAFVSEAAQQRRSNAVASIPALTNNKQR